MKYIDKWLEFFKDWYIENSGQILNKQHEGEMTELSKHLQKWQ